MTNTPPQHDPPSAVGDTPRTAPDRALPPSTPRWVKILGIITVVLIVVVLLAMLLGGEHGPGRHGGATTPSGAIALISDGVRQA